AIAMGFGFGTGEACRAMVQAVLASGRPAVLDADALTSAAEDPAALFAALRPDVLLTPHDGEFARLFPDLAATLGETAEGKPLASRVDVAAAAAARAGATVLLKGPDTVIASPALAEPVIVSARRALSAPWLATAGSGDVMGGMGAGVVGRGYPPPDAAARGARLPAPPARAVGPGLIAEDLPEAVPGVLRRLGL
ncbi:MAG: NAD(P)H-hydrate dehydratase, partial [Pseudomonadota bacterium]